MKVLYVLLCLSLPCSFLFYSLRTAIREGLLGAFFKGVALTLLCFLWITAVVWLAP